MDIIKKVKELNLPAGSYVVFGSGPLQIHGIRDSQDVDLIVTQEVYDDLKSKGWEESELSGGKTVLKNDIYDVGIDWGHGDYRPQTSMLIQTADIIDGVPFANLLEVMKWKRSMGREKDVNDVLLIQKYFDSNR